MPPIHKNRIIAPRYQYAIMFVYVDAIAVVVLIGWDGDSVRDRDARTAACARCQIGNAATDGYTDLISLPYEGNSKFLIQNSKLIKDGHLLIERNGIRYDAHGARVK